MYGFKYLRCYTVNDRHPAHINGMVTEEGTSLSRHPSMEYRPRGGTESLV